MNKLTTPIAMDEATARRNAIRQAQAQPVSLPNAPALDQSLPEETRGGIPASDLPGIRSLIAAALARPEHKDVAGVEYRRLAQLAATLVEAIEEKA